MVRKITVRHEAPPALQRDIISLLSSTNLEEVEVPAKKYLLRALASCIRVQHITITVRKGDNRNVAFNALVESPPLVNVVEVALRRESDASEGFWYGNHLQGCMLHFFNMFREELFEKFPNMLRMSPQCCPNEWDISERST